MPLKFYFKLRELWLDDIDQPVAECFNIALKDQHSQFRTLKLGSAIAAESLNIIAQALIHPHCKIQTIILQPLTDELYQLLFTALRQVPGRYQFYFAKEPGEWDNTFQSISSISKEDVKRHLFSSSAHPIFPGPLPLSSRLLPALGEYFPNPTNCIVSPFTYIPIRMPLSPSAY